MAKPANPLDQFTTYTYHFELHAAATDEELISALTAATDETTTRAETNGTLLINSRYDAHQIIDDVQFEYVAPGVTGTTFMPVGELKMEITEPGACYFLEKLKSLKDKLNVNSHTGIVYALKILFVGRTPDNEIVMLDSYKPILLSMVNIDAAFDFKGGRYHLNFVTRNSMLSGRNPNDSAFLALGFCNKNISIQAETTQEAVSQLQSKLIEHYDKTFEKEGDKGPARKVTYVLNLDGKLNAKIDNVNKDSRDPSEKPRFTFNSGMPITSMIMEILRASPTLNEKIAASTSGLKKPKNPGVFFPVIVPSVKYTESEAQVLYTITPYEGGSAEDFEFDFYFTEAGKNVDVQDFDMKFPNAFEFWVATENKYGSIFATNRNAEIPELSSKKFKDIVNKDSSSAVTEEFVEVEKKTLDLKSNDIAPLPSKQAGENHQHNTTNAEDISGKRGAQNATAEFKTTAGRTGLFILRIRGHAGMLDNQSSAPGETGYGVNQGLWVKVNIFDEEGRQFYYKDYYRCLSIVNKFSNGVFNQEIGLFEMPDVS